MAQTPELCVPNALGTEDQCVHDAHVDFLSPGAGTEQSGEAAVHLPFLLLVGPGGLAVAVARDMVLEADLEFQLHRQ